MILLLYSNFNIKGTEILGCILYLYLLRPTICACVKCGRTLIIATLILGLVFSDYVIFYGQLTFIDKMVKTGQFTTKCKGDRVIALKRQKSLWYDST